MTTTRIKVDVTQEDIDHGVQSDCRKCPVARAISRALGFQVEAYSTIGIWLSDSDKVPTPAIASAFIRQFDEFKPVSPFSFDLEVPTELVKQ